MFERFASGFTLIYYVNYTKTRSKVVPKFREKNEEEHLLKLREHSAIQCVPSKKCFSLNMLQTILVLIEKHAKATYVFRAGLFFLIHTVYILVCQVSFDNFVIPVDKIIIETL